jgi:hypothetical protein
MPDVERLGGRVEGDESVRVRDLRCQLEALANEASMVAEQADQLTRCLRDRAQWLVLLEEQRLRRRR